MIGLLFVTLIVLLVLFGFGFVITGAILKTLIWLCVSLPVAILLIVIGLICCCTIILLPVGFKLFGVAVDVLIPG